MTRMTEAEYRRYMSRKNRPDTANHDIRHEHVDDGYRLIIPDRVPPGMNDLHKLWSGPDDSEYGKVRDNWVWWIRAALGAHRPSFKRARIAMTLHQVGSMDQDNLEASFKVVGDALQIVGVILNDDRKTIVRPPVESVHVKYSVDVKTVLEITELK